ncbi:MAG: restriction endonuclease [Rhodoferax sp.]|uniref:restriction endonuclease n=1 Tax=Rhodoferax sp. TaxID=50421 RepID=UPI002632E111|nr:restriction endonuclease [Rhodoferax sp.]MDD5332403.1 restriction endonuclease [Rhodoferax sp.]
MARDVYTVTVTHDGLGKSRVITGSNQFVVREKAGALEQEWNVAWSRKQAALQDREKKEANRQADLRNKQQSREELQSYKEDQAKTAQERTQEAVDAIDAVKGLLTHTLSVNDMVNWDRLKRREKFSQPRPRRAQVAEPTYINVPPKPDRADKRFNADLVASSNLTSVPRQPSPFDQEFRPVLGFFARLFTSEKRKQEMADAACQLALPDWVARCAQVNVENERLLQAKFDRMTELWCEAKQKGEEENARLKAQLDTETERVKLSFEQDLSRYQAAKTAFEIQQEEHNQSIDKHKANFEALETGAVFDYFDLVLNASEYPEHFPREWEIDYLADIKTLVVNFTLPAPSHMPTLKEVKYLVTRDELKESFFGERETNALYDSALYQITLRTVHELFESDYANALDAIVFNGIVHGVDKTNGHNTTACVLSLQASKEEFMAIQLANIDPKACFKKLKGVGSSQLHGLSPVAPILWIEKSDSRFVDAYAVADGLDEATNLAAMDWEDFEHLVRELFEKEFRTTGGEVRITQASRDGGVDAVAFDPDPIRGGKIVIQAKRYTNVVGVSAVRDLYGTVMNEGATKGILVTTADYGADSYEFAKGKPLTLLNGSNLLHLLAKHGHKATIDIQAARASQ